MANAASWVRGLVGSLLAAGMLAVCMLAIAGCVTGCVTGCTGGGAASSIVGTWVVKAEAAPFQYHLFVFNADGTMQQANPDAGDARTSDSDGKGIWVVAAGRIRGKPVSTPLAGKRVTLP